MNIAKLRRTMSLTSLSPARRSRWRCLGALAEAVTLTYYIATTTDQRGDGRGAEGGLQAEEPRHQDRDRDRIRAAARATTSSRPGWRRARCPTCSATTAGSLFRALNPPETMRRSHRRAASANVIDSFKPVVSVGRQGLRRAGRGRDGRRHPLQQEDLRRPRPVRAKVLGRVHGQQREDQGGRQGAGDPDLRRHLDQPALRARRLLQRAGGGARLRRQIHRQQGQVRDHACRDERLRATGGGVQGRRPQRGFRGSQVRRRGAHGGHRRRRALPDADLRHRRHRAELSRQPQGRRLLRHAGRRRRVERPDRLDAGRRLHRQDAASIPRRPSASSTFIASPRAATSAALPTAPPAHT